MIAGTLTIELVAEMARLSSDMKKAESLVTSSMRVINDAAAVAMKSLGAIGLGLSASSFVSMIRGAIDAADRLNDLSKSTGVAVEQLAGLKLLAQQSGTDMDGLAKGVNRMLVEIGKSPEKFRALGVTAKDGVGALKQLADIFNLLPDVTQRNALAQAIFGKSWAELAPVLSEGSQKIGETIEKGARLSGITKEMAAAADEFNDKLAQLSGTHGLLNGQVVSLLPLLNSIADDLVNLQEAAVGADSGFHPLAETFRALLVLGGNVSFVFKGIGTEIGVLAAQADALGLGFTDLLNPAAAVAKAATAGAEGWRKFNAIGAEARAEAAKSREAFDAWEKKTMAVGTALAVVGDTSDAMSRKLQGQQRAEQAATAARAKAFLDAENAAKDSTAAYDRLMKSIREKIALVSAEIAAGRPLTEQEKFDAKAKADIEDLLKRYPGISATKIAAVQNEVKAADELFKKEAELAAQQNNNANYAKEWAKDEADITAALVAHAAARDAVNKALADEATALADANLMLEAEAGLLGASDQARAAALGNLQIEIDLKNQIEAINRNLLLGEKERTAAIAAAMANADAKKAMVEERAALQEQIKLLNDIESEGKNLWEILWQGGDNTFKKLGQSLKAFFFDLLYQMTAKRWIVSIGASVTGGGAIADAAGGGAGGAGSLLSGAGSLFGGGASAFSTGAGATMTNMFATGGTAANMANIGTALGGGEIMSAIGMAAPYLAIAMAAYAILAPMFKGETRSGGQYTGSHYVAGPSGGEIQGDSVRKTIDLTTASINDLLKTAGSSQTLKLFQSGFESSEKGKGFAYAGGQLSGGKVFGQGGWQAGTVFDEANYGMNTNRGSMTAEEAAAKFTEELKQATLQALQSADVPGQLGEYLKSLGDIDKLSGGALEAALAKVQKALTEKAALEDQYYALTHTDVENMALARSKERDALDESNRALYDQVAALVDQKAAAEAAAAAAAAAAQKQAAILNERLGLEGQLLQLQGNTTELRNRERAALDESNRAIYDQINALKDKTAADQAAAAALAHIKDLVLQVSASVSDTIFGMQYGMGSNMDKYAMLDVKGKGIDDKMRSATDIDVIAKMANDEIALLTQAWGLLDAGQQKASYSQFESKLESIDTFVTEHGADATGLAQARDAKTAQTIADAVNAAIATAMGAPAGQMTDAAAAITAAAAVPAVAAISVSVTKSPGTEVSIR